MSKVLLVNLPIQAYYQKDFHVGMSYNPSMGLISIATWLRLNGWQADIVDLCYERINAREFIKRVREIDPIIVGISVYTENIDMAFLICEQIKKEMPHIKTALGGPHPTLSLKHSIDNPYVDFVISGEGESVFLELIGAIETNERLTRYENIMGLSYKKGGKIYINKRRRRIADLDLLPVLNREIMGIDLYNDVVNISTSRGCPGNCIYCAATALSGATYRVREIGGVFLEIVLLKYLLGEKIKKIYIVDDTFTAIPKRVMRFAEMIIESGVNFMWHCESRVDVMNEELLDMMKNSNCIAIQYGIESGSQKVLDEIHKGINLDMAKDIIQKTYDRGILPCLSFIVGHFCDTPETMEETIEFVKFVYENYRAEIAVSFNTPFPGTYQYTHLEKLGMRLVTDKLRNYSLLTPIIETNNFTIYDQQSAFYKAKRYIARYTVLEKLRMEVESE